jgi:hypothetical protein
MTRVVSLDLAAKPYASPSLDVKIALSGNACLVPGCDYLAGDAYICPTCVEAWECQLGNVAALVEDLELAQRKQVRFGDPSGGHSSQTDPPMPIDLAAGYWLHRLHNELVGQIRLICEVNGLDVPRLDTTVAMSRWLLGQSARIAYLPEADGWGLIHDLDQCYRDCVGQIDAPARRKYVRVCECGLSVWATRETARCACGAEYDVEAEYEARMEFARDALVTLAEAADGGMAKLDTIKKWIRRGKIDAHGEPQRVRYGDVLDLAASAKEKTA